VAEGCCADQPLATWRTAIKPGHVRLGPGFIEKDQLFRPQTGLQFTPGPARFGDKEPTFSFSSIQGVPYGAATIPLLDYSGAEIGVIIAMISLAPEQRSLRRLAVATAAAGLIALIGLAGIILLLFRGLILRPVAIIADALEAPAGAAPPNLPKPGASPELDRLIRAAARTREPTP
jgi:hypothetical protein